LNFPARGIDAKSIPGLDFPDEQFMPCLNNDQTSPFKKG
jgi:hypothetical protein